MTAVASEVLQGIFTGLLLTGYPKDLKVTLTTDCDEPFLLARGRPAQTYHLQVFNILIILGQVVALSHCFPRATRGVNEAATDAQVGTTVTRGWYAFGDTTQLGWVLICPMARLHQVRVEVGRVHA